MDLQFRALRIKQGPAQRRGGEAQELIVGALPVGEILKRADVDYVPNGYQRPLRESRLREVAEYVRNDLGVLPTSVLLSVRGEDSLSFEPTEDLGYAEVGLATVPGDTTFWVVDGQHRLFGFRHAIEEAQERNGPASEELEQFLRAFVVPVAIFCAPDKYVEMRTFFVVNSKQRGVPTDVVDELLFQTRTREGVEMERRPGGAQERRRAKATAVAKLLAGTPGQPWFDRILLTGQKPSPRQYRVKQHAMVASLDPVLRDPLVDNASDQEVSKLVANYWVALSTLMPEAFDAPEDHFVQKTTGVYAWHMVFPDVLVRCRPDRDYTADRFREILGHTGEYVTSTFWHAKHGDPLAWGTGMKSIRYLAALIKEKLPPLRIPALTTE